MNKIAKVLEEDPNTYGGYFKILGDIEYNGEYIPMMDHLSAVRLTTTRLLT
jgi:hypothetical protein